MRRRMLDCGRVKRLPSKKSRITETVQSSSVLHWKILIGWLVLLLLDSLTDFRFEYLYPVAMFVHSVYDSYKYQGLMFSVMFICLVAYLDLLCWTVLTGPWLFLLASSCVWFEMMRSTDHGFSYTAVTWWMLFLYVEVSYRLHNLPQHLLNVSRPFAAHCIGYPMVTVSFLVKHQITHVIRQHQQKVVSEENAFYFEILNRALPHVDREEPVKGAQSLEGEASKENEPKITKLNSKNSTSNGNSGGGGGGGGSKVRPQSSGTKHSKGVGSSGGGGGKSTEQRERTGSTSKPHPSPLLPGSPPPSSAPSDNHTHSGTGGSAVANGDVHRPLSAGGRSHTGKKHLTSAKDHSPKSEQAPVAPSPATQTETKMIASMEAELVQERHLRSVAESCVAQLDLEVKKLKADLQASCLQEEETSQRVGQLSSLERSQRLDLQRLRTESENLQQKLQKLASFREHGEQAIVKLEKQLVVESTMRSKVEAELQEHRNCLWNEGEMKELKERLREVGVERERFQKELQSTRKELMRGREDAHQDHGRLQGALKAMEEECRQLRDSLTDETRVKIDLLTALSDARRKQEGMAEELVRRNVELGRLQQQNLMLAMMPGHPVTTSSYSPHSTQP